MSSPAPCYACGYDLFRNSSDVCPECGATLSPLAAERHRARLGARYTLLALVSLLGTAIASSVGGWSTPRSVWHEAIVHSMDVLILGFTLLAIISAASLFKLAGGRWWWLWGAVVGTFANALCSMAVWGLANLVHELLYKSVRY